MSGMMQLIEGLIMGEPSTDIIRISGDFSFFLEPVIQGTLPNHNCSLTVVCYSSSDRKVQIDVDIKWYKILNGDTYEVRDYKEIYYHFNPADIDLSIKCHICSREPKYPGSATILIGPVVLDGSLKPEIEGMCINQKSAFKVLVVAIDDKPIRPNASTIRVEKPYLYLTYDPGMVGRETDKSRFEPLMLDFETDPDVKIRIDPTNINNILINYKNSMKVETKLKIKFDSRMQRDIFYIYHKLMRILKKSVIDEILVEYEKLFKYDWSFLKHKIAENRDSMVDFEVIYNFDLVREHLKAMVRLNKELNEENTTLLDSLDILEADLELSSKEFRSLIEDQKTSKKLTRKDITRYEKSSQSIIQESSMIVDGVKVKDKRKKKELDDERIGQMRELEDDIKAVKRINEIFKKEIEALKGLSKPAGSSPSNVHNLMDSVNLSVIQVDDELMAEADRCRGEEEVHGRSDPQVQQQDPEEDRRDEGL
jgi:hypothetical protein